MKSYIIFRTDRIGDLVLSISVAELIKKNDPESKVTFVVRSYTASILENNPYIDEVISVDDLGVFDLVKVIKKNNYDVSIVLFSTFKSAMSSFIAGVPLRIGPMSKWFSIFFNKRIKQKRSRCEKNEAEYNIDLLKPLGIEGLAYPKLYITKTESEIADKYVKDIGGLGKRLVILHPGSGHSSKNWPLKKYFELVVLLKKNESIKILITGNQDEILSYDKYIKEYNIDKTEILNGEFFIREFLGIISKADLLITNSTGPLHCAVALGVNTIGFYSPVRVCTPKRWGPFSDESEKHQVLMPNVETCERCIFEKCKYFNCMDMIKVDEVFNIVMSKFYNLEI